MSREEIGVAAVAWGSWGMGSREGFVTLGRVQYPLRYLALFFFFNSKIDGAGQYPCSIDMGMAVKGRK